MQADFPARINLLRAFAELDEGWRGDMNEAIAAMQAERGHRLAQSATEITSALIDCLTFTEQGAITADADTAGVHANLSELLFKRIRWREQNARRAVQGHYRHETLQRDELNLALLDMDLFTAEGWELFGLSKTQLLITGSATGAVAGLGVDALVGGSSLLLGAGIGALVGGVGSWFGSDELAKTKILGTSLGGRMLHVGPVSALNFPWVLLGRAWVHHHLVKERNHALRDALSSALGGQQNMMNTVPDEIRHGFARVFRNLQKSGPSAKLNTVLHSLVMQLLEETPS